MQVLDELSNFLNDDVMRKLNYKVDEERQSPSDVAHSFLIENNLLAN